MSTMTLIMGESGTGKSSSIRTLVPSETFIINVLDKPLPFKGARANYKVANQETVNYYATDKAESILKTIKFIEQHRPDINVIIIDDFQYIMANEFMRRARESGFAKFTEIGKNAWEIIYTAGTCREDLYFFILSHTESDGSGKVKCKTIGKMIDEKINLEGMFTVVLHSLVADGKYQFLTQNDGCHIAKSPMGMFDNVLIDNDLHKIKERMISYFGDSEL